MQKISNLDELKASIKELELKTHQQEQLLKRNSTLTARGYKEHYKPMNLVRMGLQKVITTPDVRYTIINTFIGLAAGWLAQKIVVGKSRNIFRRTLGAAVQAALVRLAYKNLPLFYQNKSSRTISPSRQIAAVSTGPVDQSV
ncbi:MAG: hypothetical protein INR73_10095 [Williamsia sp.]|nr:hypothetical protein [Williamsia sp.]